MPTLSQFKMALEAVSTFKTKHYFQFYPICNWIEGKSVAASWNAGVKQAIADGMDYVFVANDDILLSETCVDRMVDAFDDPDIGLITGTDCKFLVNEPRDIVTYEVDDYSVVSGPDFALFAIRPECFVEVGDFDEEFKPAYFEDNDYCRRLVVHNRWKVLRHAGASFYHYGSITQNTTGPTPVCPGPKFERNRDYYIRKWGGMPNEEKFLTPFGKD